MSVLKQDHFAYEDFSVLDTVIMGNKRLYDIMKQKDALYAKEDFTEEEMEQVFETSVYEMIASKSGSDDNLIIAVEKLPMEMTEETYAQIAVANLTALESLDCDIEISDDYVMIGDVEFLEITSITKYDVLTFAQNIYVNIKEDRATVITITHEDDEATKDLLLSGFQAH